MSRGPAHGLWWASPVGGLLLVLPVSIWLAWSTSDLSFRLLYRTPRLLDDTTSLLFAAAAGTLLLGVLVALAAAPRRWPDRWAALDSAQLDVLERAAAVCFGLTMFGYVCLGAAGALRGASPGVLLSALTQQDNFSGDIERAFAPIAGITSFTQLGVAYSTLAALCWTSGRQALVARRMAVVVVLGLLRAFYLTERLALIEVVVPFILVVAVARQRRGDLRAALAPAVGLPGLVVLFGIFEYSRSWTFFRTRTTSSYPEFVVDRLAGYYATAYNNGAAQLQFGHFPGRLPYFSLEAFWTAPGIAQLDLYTRLTGRSATEVYAQVLRAHTNPEFNNPCGICSPFVDFGTVGGLLFMLVAGLLLGRLWVLFRDGAVVGLLAYPVVFVGVLELPRYLYWTQGRLVPVTGALAVVALLLRNTQPAGPAPPRLPPLPALVDVA